MVICILYFAFKGRFPVGFDGFKAAAGIEKAHLGISQLAVSDHTVPLEIGFIDRLIGGRPLGIMPLPGVLPAIVVDGGHRVRGRDPLRL